MVQSGAGPEQTQCCYLYKRLNCPIQSHTVYCNLTNPQESHSKPHTKLLISTFQNTLSGSTPKLSMQLDHSCVNQKRRATQNYMQVFLRLELWLIKINLQAVTQLFRFSSLFQFCCFYTTKIWSSQCLNRVKCQNKIKENAVNKCCKCSHIQFNGYHSCVQCCCWRRRISSVQKHKETFSEMFFPQWMRKSSSQHESVS